MDGFPLLEVLSVSEGHGVFNAAPHHAGLGHGFGEHSAVDLILHLLKNWNLVRHVVTAMQLVSVLFLTALGTQCNILKRNET